MSSIATIVGDPSEIERWPGRSTHLTHERRWLLAEHGRSGATNAVIAVPTGDSPSLVLPCTKFDWGHRHNDYDPIAVVRPGSPLPSLSHARISPASGAHLAVAALPHSNEGPFITSARAGPNDFVAAIEKFEEWALELNCTAATFLGMREGARIAKRLTESGYVPVELEPWSVMEDLPGSFDEWLQSLSRQARNNVRRELRETRDDLVIQVKGVEGLGPEARDLLVEKYVRYGHPRQHERVSGLFDRLRAWHGDQVRVITAMDDTQRLVGFAAVILGARDAAVRCDANLGVPFLHFVLTYYEVVRLCCSLGLTRIHYGTASYEAKSYRGCTFHPRFAYVRDL